MSEKFKCKNCNGEEFEMINIQKSFQKELKAGHLILFIFFTLLSTIGIVIILYNAIELTSLEMPTLKESEEIIEKFLYNLLIYKQCQAKIYIGIGLFLLGFVGVIFTFIFYNIDPTYNIKNETRKLCLTCGKKWKIDSEQNPENEN